MSQYIYSLNETEEILKDKEDIILNILFEIPILGRKAR
jgi:hypothetical protein